MAVRHMAAIPRQERGVTSIFGDFQMFSDSSSDVRCSMFAGLVASVFVLTACSTSPSSTGDETISAPLLFVSGLVSPSGASDSLHRQLAGTEVILTGTNFRAFTNDSGYW